MALTDDYLTISQVAERLKVTRQTVSRWISQGIIEGERIGREVLLKKSDIEPLRCPACGRLIINRLKPK